MLHFLANKFLKYWWSQDEVINNMFTKHIYNLFPLPAAGGTGGGDGPFAPSCRIPATVHPSVPLCMAATPSSPCWWWRRMHLPLLLLITTTEFHKVSSSDDMSTIK